MERKYALKPDVRHSGETLFRDRVTAPESLPPKVDLRPGMPPIVDQGPLGSCTSNALVSGFREYWLLKEKHPNPGLSRLYHYWHERSIEGTVNEDAGATLSDGMNVLLTLGVPPEDLWPYHIDQFAAQPSPVAEQYAGSFKIKEANRISSLDELKHSIALGNPVAIGVRVYTSFESADVAKTGVIPMPNPAAEECLGGHAMLAVGYDDVKQQVIVRNSWGTGWGDQGYCYFPYTFISNPTLTHDMWTGIAYYTEQNVTYDQAIELIAGKGIFDSPDFWKQLGAKYNGDETSDFRYLQLAFRKMAAYLMNQEG